MVLNLQHFFCDVGAGDSITSQKMYLIRSILLLFDDTEVFTEIFILAKFFGETFSENSHVDDFGSSLPTSLYSTNLKLCNISLTLKMAWIIADPWFLRGICCYLYYSGGFDELMCLKELYFEDGGKDLFVIPDIFEKLHLIALLSTLRNEVFFSVFKQIFRSPCSCLVLLKLYNLIYQRLLSVL